jgi:hypothetical protein
MEEQEAEKTNTASTASGSPTDSSKQDQQQQQQQQQHLKMKEETVPRGSSGTAALSPARPTLNSFTFSMPSNNDDHSIASTLTMSTIKTDRSESMDVFDFPGETPEGDEGVAHVDDEQASSSTPDPGCFQFEKAMDSVFVKIYEVFLDEDAMMLACQDDPTQGTPILEYNSVPDIPAVISMTSDPAPEPSSASVPSKEGNAQPSSTLHGIDLSPISHEDIEAETPTKRPSRATIELNAAVAPATKDIQVKDDNDDAEFDSSPWRLDSILYSSPERKDESIEVGERGQVVFEETIIELDVSFSEPSPKTKKPVIQKPPSTLEKRDDIFSQSHKKQDSFSSQPVPSFRQSSLHSLENSSTAKLSKKRSLGLRYLFSPRLRKINVLPWRRLSPKKYQNMRTLDDPSYSPETVTTLEPSTLHSDGLSFQCDLSLKTSSVMSLKTASVLMKQDLHPTPTRGVKSGSLSYAYPQNMVA